MPACSLVLTKVPPGPWLFTTSQQMEWIMWSPLSISSPTYLASQLFFLIQSIFYFRLPPLGYDPLYIYKLKVLRQLHSDSSLKFFLNKFAVLDSLTTLIARVRDDACIWHKLPLHPPESMADIANGSRHVFLGAEPGSQSLCRHHAVSLPFICSLSWTQDHICMILACGHLGFSYPSH